jgi:hypothetical protein
MSHFSKCSTKIKNLASLKLALEELGLAFTESSVDVQAKVRGWQGAKVDAALSIDMGKYDIGIVQNQDGSYDMVADWWGVEITKGISQEEFVDQVNQQYAYQQIVVTCEENGYNTEDVKTEEDGTISLIAKKWE